MTVRRVDFLDPTVATLASGATASAAGVSMPGPIRVGSPLLPNQGPNGEFNLAGGIGADENGNVYALDIVNAKIRKYNSAGTQLASIAIPANCYGLAVDQVNQRVYITVDVDAANGGGPRVRWYDYALTGQQGHFSVNAISRGILVLATGNVLVFNDASPYEIREYSNAGVFQATWYTGTATYRPTRGTSDGTWIYVNFSSTFSALNRVVRKLLIADRGVTQSNHMPGTYQPSAGTQDLPLSGADKVGDYHTRVLGLLGGKLYYLMMSFYTLMGVFEADPTTATFERLILGRTGEIGGTPAAYDANLFDAIFTSMQAVVSTYSVHTLHFYDIRTPTAQWNNIAQYVGGFGTGAKLRRFVAEGWDARKAKLQYRINAGAWTDVTMSDNAILGGTGIDVEADVVDVLLSMNTWRGFNTSDVIGPLDKSAPVIIPGFEWEENDPPAGPRVVVEGNLELDTGAASDLVLE